MPPVDSTPDLPEPTATGTLAKTPLAHLLVYAHDRELTGTFDFAGPTGQAATILFIEGQPTKARTTEATVYLGKVLFELGVLGEEQLAILLPRLLGSKELHGQILLTEGLITEEQLELALRAQLVRQMKSLVRLPPETTYKYYDCFDGLASYGGDGHVGIDAFPVVWACIRDEPPWEHIQLGLQRIGSSGLRLTDAAETSRFAFEKAERTTVELLRQKPWRLHELTSTATLAPKLVQLLAYCLLVTKQVELVRESKIPGAPVSEEPIPEAPPSSPFSGNLIEAPLPRTVARVQLAQRPVTRAPVVVEDDTGPGKLASETADGRTSYVATQPRSFTKKRNTKVDIPAVTVPVTPTLLSEGTAAPERAEAPSPAGAEVSATPVADVAVPPAATEEAAPAPTVEPAPEARPKTVSSDSLRAEIITAPPPANGVPAVEPDIFHIPTPPSGVAAVGAPEGDSSVEGGATTAAPTAEVHTRPTVPKMAAVTPDQIAAHMASEAMKKSERGSKAPALADATAQPEAVPSVAEPRSPRPPDARTPPASRTPQSLTIETPVSVQPTSPPQHLRAVESTRGAPPSAAGARDSASPAQLSVPPISGPPTSVSPVSGGVVSKPRPISVKEQDDDDDAPPSSRASHAAERAMQMTADLVARKKEIQDKAAVLDKEDYYTVLGVSRETPTAEIQKTFFALAKKWHPDRVPPVLADVKELCAKVFAKMSEAHQTLMDPAKRAKYDSSKKAGSDDSPEAQAQVMAILEAATNFQKAEICLKRNDFKQAEELCRKAIAVEPKQADYISMMAWLEAQKPTKQDALSTQDQIQQLTRAIGISQACERAFFYRAMLYKRAGQESNAVKDFKRAMELNPRNVDAQREVRLYNMRGGDKAPAGKGKDEGGGLFGKLFKKS